MVNRSIDVQEHTHSITHAHTHTHTHTHTAHMNVLARMATSILASPHAITKLHITCEIIQIILQVLAIKYILKNLSVVDTL